MHVQNSKEQADNTVAQSLYLLTSHEVETPCAHCCLMISFNFFEIKLKEQVCPQDSLTV